MRINFDQGGQSPGLLTRVAAAVVGTLALVAAFMFSLVFVIILVVAGAGVWLYFWWKTRELRRQMREQVKNQEYGQPSASADAGGDVIEGESVRVVDEQNRLSD